MNTQNTIKAGVVAILTGAFSAFRRKSFASRLVVMLMSRRTVVILATIGILAGCKDKSVVGPVDNGDNGNVNPNLKILEPENGSVHWMDSEYIPCVTNAPAEKKNEVIWKVDEETVDCKDDKLDMVVSLKGDDSVSSEYSVSASLDDKTDEANITVFTVPEISITEPQEDVYWEDEGIPCSVEIHPAEPESKVVWRVNSSIEQSLSGKIKLNVGEYNISAEVTLEGRTFSTDKIFVEVLPVISGKVYFFNSFGE